MPSNSGKVSLISGCTGGIGQGIAAGLAKLGGTIVVTSRDLDRGHAAGPTGNELSGVRR